MGTWSCAACICDRPSPAGGCRRAEVGWPAVSRARRWPTRLAAVLLICAAQAAAADYPLTVIELRAQLPEAVIPVLEPLAGPDGVVVGSRGALFVRAAPERVADIRRALETLDRPSRNLVVEVRQGVTRQRGQLAVGVAVDEGFEIGDGHGRVRIGPPGGTRAIAQAERGRGTLDLTQQVRVLEGQPARIRVGSERPIGHRETRSGPGGWITREHIGYADATSGFWVIPRVQGDRVILDIDTRAALPGRGGSVEAAGARSRIEGPLGAWLPLAATTSEGRLHSIAPWGAASTTGTGQIQIDVRVTELPNH